MIHFGEAVGKQAFSYFDGSSVIGTVLMGQWVIWQQLSKL